MTTEKKLFKSYLIRENIMDSFVKRINKEIKERLKKKQDTYAKHYLEQELKRSLTCTELFQEEMFWVRESNEWSNFKFKFNRVAFCEEKYFNPKEEIIIPLIKREAILWNKITTIFKNNEFSRKEIFKLIRKMDTKGGTNILRPFYYFKNNNFIISSPDNKKLLKINDRNMKIIIVQNSCEKVMIRNFFKNLLIVNDDGSLGYGFKKNDLILEKIKIETKKMKGIKKMIKIYKLL